LSGTPGRLRALSALCVLALVVAGVGGGAALYRRSAAIDEARRAAAHLVLLQNVQTNLVQADADATNAFLTFGLEPQAQRVDYIASIRTASRDLAVAAQARPADAEALGAANAALTRYTGYIASARATNREGLPLGASYLRTASDLLNAEIIPALEKRTTADLERIDTAYSRSANARWWLALVAVLGLGALILAQLYMTRTTRRIINLPAAAATVGLLAALGVAGVSMSVAQSRADDVRAGALTAARDLSRSRVAAFNAKSLESLTLIARGSGTPADPLWTAAMKRADTALPGEPAAARTALRAYAERHRAIRTLEDAGKWEEAITLAKDTGKTSANGQFAAYAAQTGAALTDRAQAVSSELRSAGEFLQPAGVLMLIVGLLAAAGAWWGIALRLDEYR
jgi:hypothetical protein